MKAESEIWIELREMAPHLAALERRFLFTAPTGYFVQLPQHVYTLAYNSLVPEPLLNLNTHQNAFVVPTDYFTELTYEIVDIVNCSIAPEPVLDITTSKQPFEAPVNYFNQLADAVLHGSQHDPVLSIKTARKPFTVPVAYFDTLADTLLQTARTSEEPEPILSIERPKLSFVIPTGYFDELAYDIVDAIKSNIAAEPALSVPSTKQPFTVPANYFAQLGDSLLEKARYSAEPEPALPTPGKTAYAAPLAYLDTLAAGILATAKASELPEPVLSANQDLKHTPFDTPYLYFDNLPQRVLDAVKAAQPVTLWDRVRRGLSIATTVRLALGVVLIGLITFGAWRWYMPKADNTDMFSEVNLQNIEKSDKVADDAINSLSDEQINTFLSTVNVTDTTVLDQMDLHDINPGDATL